VRRLRLIGYLLALVGVLAGAARWFTLLEGQALRGRAAQRVPILIRPEPFFSFDLSHPREGCPLTLSHFSHQS